MLQTEGLCHGILAHTFFVCMSKEHTPVCIETENHTQPHEAQTLGFIQAPAGPIKWWLGCC